MESSTLDSDLSQDLMRPPRALRSKRKRGSSRGKADKGNPSKKFCAEEALLKVNSDVLAIAEARFIDDLKKESDFADCGDLKTSTPNGAENLPQKRKKRGLTTEADSSVSISLSQLDVTYASEKSQADETSGDDKSLELSGVTDDSKPMERSGRRHKCTSARVLLGLEKRKSMEMTGQSKDRNETSTEMMSADRKPRMRTPKVKLEVLPQVQHEGLNISLEGLPDTPTSLSVERCSVVKPVWLKPFKLGWRREIVFRNTVKTSSSSKQLCDVYYFSSDDTKLRSLPQIVEYLKGVKSTLTGECFTFTKCAIYKEPQEIVRAAAFSRGRLANRTGLLSSNEGSIKSFDEANDDAASQASSTGTNRQRKLKETLANNDSCKADVPVKTEEPVISVLADSPIPPVKLDIKKEEASPDIGVTTSVDETDKRQAVRAAATLALRTYMSHALRTVNNPLLQSGNVKPRDKDKTVLSKSPTKVKSATLLDKHCLPRKSLSPVVSIKRLSSNRVDSARNRSQPEENVRQRKGPPSAMNLTKLNTRRSDESFSSRKSKEPTTSKVVTLKARSLVSAAAAAPRPRSAEKSIRDLKKMSPLKKSTPKLSVSTGSPSGAAASFEKINAAIKALMSTKDAQPSLKKLSKSHQQATPLPTKALSNSKTPMTLPSPVVKILPKSDGKSNEKPSLSTEKKPAVAPASIVPKPVESCLNETSRICGMDCPGRLGIPPTLPCATCMCLFHPECAGYTSHMYFTPQMDFTCWACGKLNKELENTAYGLYKRETSTLETSSIEASSRNLKKQQTAVGKSTSNGLNSAGDTSAIALSTPIIQQSSNYGTAAAAAAAMELPSVLHPSIILSGMSTDEVTVSCGPSAQLLVIPAALARHLNMSHPLTLLVDDREVRVKPEQLKVSGVGLNIMLPMGSVPDAFVEGPGKPLEFRVVSTAESGCQAVAVSLFERPLKFSSALETFSASTAHLTPLSKSDYAGQSHSGITNLSQSNSLTSDPTTSVRKHDKDERNLESSSDQATVFAKGDGPLPSDEAMGEAMAFTTSGAVVAECKTVVATQHLDITEDFDLDKSESKPGVSGMVTIGKMTENENIISEIELSTPERSQRSPTEAMSSSSLETEAIGISTDTPRADVSMETECFFPITESPVDSIIKTHSSCERSGGNEHGTCGVEMTKCKSPVACCPADESKEGTTEKQIEELAAVIGNSSAASCERDETDVLGNQLESTETKAETESSIKTDALSSTQGTAAEKTDTGLARV